MIHLGDLKRRKSVLPLLAVFISAFVLELARYLVPDVLGAVIMFSISYFVPWAVSEMLRKQTVVRNLVRVDTAQS